MFDPLDPRQLTRIEAVHRGFLYQHLYGAACLLLAGASAVRSVTVELDEDVEIELGDGERLYLQVKTRSSALIYSDISGALDRFVQLRLEHEEGRRPAPFKFVIVTNVPLGPDLQARMRAGYLPSDVTMLTPESTEPRPACLPPGWPDVASAVHWCVQQARALPMATLEPETLIWKLAGRVLLAAAGQGAGHVFDTATLHELFEQLIVQLQRFPAPPDIYRPLDDEPALDTGARVRIITGHSGAGKSAWAAQAARHLGGTCAYYDVGDLPGPAIAASLVRELAAQWVTSSGDGLRQILLPGPSGLEPLRALDAFLGERSITALVVLDNAHRVSAHDLRGLIEATQHLRMVFLGQPSASLAELEATLGLQQEPLQGWGLDQAAAEVDAQAAHASAAALGRLLVLTGGLPLYVRNAAQLSTAQYSGDVDALCDALETHTHLAETAQELVLSQSFNLLSESIRHCVAVLSLSDVPMSEAEAGTLVKAAFGLDAATLAKAVRTLQPLGIVRINGARRLQIHDAFRVIGNRLLVELPAQARAGREALRQLLVASFVNDRDASRLPLFVRTLVELGDLAPLLDIATEEFFHELGVDGGIWEMLKAAAVDDAISPEQRFHALDALVFANLKVGDVTEIDARLSTMESLVVDHKLGSREALVVLLKRMVFEADNGNRPAAEHAIERAQQLTPDQPDYQRILRYNIAHARYHLRDYGQAEAMARALVDDYYRVLGLTPKDVMQVSQEKIAAALTQTDSLSDDLKHLADSLDMLAKARNAQGRDSGVARVHAMKFYALAHALSSLIAVGQDLVDEFVARSDYEGAREVIQEHILPVVLQHKMLGHMLSVRSQYAVVLAYCGLFDAADEALDQLAPYTSGLTAQQREEIAGQRRLIARLRRDGARPQTLVDQRPQPFKRIKVGPNENCPCGSGVKYKRCHGAPRHPG